MKPQNQRKRERARKRKRNSEWVNERERERVFVCSSCSALNCLLWHTYALNRLKAHLFTHVYSLFVSPPVPPPNSSQATFACLVSDSTAHFWMQGHSQLPGTLHFPCFATHPNFTETEWGVGESVFLVSGWHFEHSSYDWRSSLPFLFSTKQLRPSLSCRGSWESLCVSNQVVIRLNSALLHINQLLNIIVHLLLEGVIYNCEMHVVTSEI